jgi:hypothetical protein
MNNVSPPLISDPPDVLRVLKNIRGRSNRSDANPMQKELRLQRATTAVDTDINGDTLSL